MFAILCIESKFFLTWIDPMIFWLFNKLIIKLQKFSYIFNVVLEDGLFKIYYVLNFFNPFRDKRY